MVCCLRSQSCGVLPIYFSSQSFRSVRSHTNHFLLSNCSNTSVLRNSESHCLIDTHRCVRFAYPSSTMNVSVGSAIGSAVVTGKKILVFIDCDDTLFNSEPPLVQARIRSEMRDAIKNLRTQLKQGGGDLVLNTARSLDATKPMFKWQSSIPKEGVYATRRLTNHRGQLVGHHSLSPFPQSALQLMRSFASQHSGSSSYSVQKNANLALFRDWHSFASDETKTSFSTL